MRMNRGKYDEFLDFVKNFKEVLIDHSDVVQCHMVPNELSPRFWGRIDAAQAVRQPLDPRDGEDSLKTFALFGMGGVGETQIALHYANQSRKQYDAIFWVSAENTITMGQSF